MQNKSIIESDRLEETLDATGSLLIVGDDSDLLLLGMHHTSPHFYSPQLSHSNLPDYH